jgi:ADP-ribose pyrophosphatase
MSSRKKIVLDKKSIFRGKILLDVHLDKVMLPNGAEVRLECIKHPGAAAIVPFLAKDEVILIKQYRPVVDKYIWEIPAGTLKRGENPIRCAKRELEEEIGYKARSLEYLTRIYTTPGFTNERIYIYKATRLERVSISPDIDEILAAKNFTASKIRQMFKSKKIIDAKTIAGLVMCGIL